MTTKSKKLIDDSELCRILDIHRTTLYKWRKKNWFPFYQIGRNIKYDLDEVLEFAKSLNKPMKDIVSNPFQTLYDAILELKAEVVSLKEMRSSGEDKLLTRREAAAYLKVHVDTKVGRDLAFSQLRITEGWGGMVAGREYAGYVEGLGRSVLTTATFKLEDDIEYILQNISV